MPAFDFEGLQRADNRLRIFVAAMMLLAIITAAVQPAGAAGTAYAVDTAEVGEKGSCKVEGWGSWASNRDTVITTAPACVVSNLPRIEFSNEFIRARSDDDWVWAVSPKVKVNLIPTAIGHWGFAAASGFSQDLKLGKTTSEYVNFAATYRVSELFRLNFNSGWLHDREQERHFATYGAGLDWLFAPKFSMTLEVFGQFSEKDLGSETRPRLQSGLRYRPVEQLSIDLIYGRNINGENADWVTLSTTIRFNAF